MHDGTVRVFTYTVLAEHIVRSAHSNDFQEEKKDLTSSEKIPSGVKQARCTFPLSGWIDLTD